MVGGHHPTSGATMGRAFLAGLAFTALIAGPTVAADMEVKTPPPVVLPFSWSGCYVGGNAGWIRNDSTLNVKPGGRYLLVFPADLLAAMSSQPDLSARGSAATAGVQAGCNWQSANSVFGLEGDFNWSGIKDTVNASFPDIVVGGGSFLATNQTITHRLDWFSTIRARIGYSFDHLLVYGTGGFAFGGVKSSFLQVFPGAPGLFDQGSAARTRYGFTLGGGLEYAFSGNWSAKLEYLYIDLASFNDLGRFSYDSPASDDPRFVWTTTFKTREHVLRLGLNYRFGG
jgi:outer membrane immunogenic protein